MDNSIYHNPRKISLELEHNKIERAPHPTYSPDISPCGFWLFGFLKEKLKEQELSTSGLFGPPRSWMPSIRKVQQ
jgi:transposase